MITLEEAFKKYGKPDLSAKDKLEKLFETHLSNGNRADANDLLTLFEEECHDQSYWIGHREGESDQKYNIRADLEALCADLYEIVKKSDKKSTAVKVLTDKIQSLVQEYI